MSCVFRGLRNQPIILRYRCDINRSSLGARIAVACFVDPLVVVGGALRGFVFFLTNVGTNWTYIII